MTEFVTPQLRTVLKTYQSSATKSLQGPGLSLAQHHHHHHHQQQQQQQQQQHHHHHQQQHHHQHKKDNQHHHHQQQQQQHNNHHHNNHHHNTTSSTSSDDDLTNNNDDIDTIIQYIQPPELTQPIISAADTGRGVLYETILEKKPIGCFLLGGEMRLCLPQFLNNVLTDFTLEQINRIFDELRIFCSQCTPEQLNEFKQAKILPNDCKQSGLITKTNAERLCSALLHNNNNNHHHQQQQHHQHQQQHNNQNNLRILNKPLLIHNNIITTTTINPNNLNNGTTTITTTTTAAASSTNNNTNANTNDNTNTNSTIATTTTIKNNTNNTNNLIKFKIIHRCFGKCEGICIPELYKYNESLCIECIECNLLFSPKKFVLHVHRQNEIQTCHWGFDSNNWRSYIHISTNDNNLNSKENLNYDKYRKILDELKEREKYEDPDTINMILLQRDVTTTNLKRKAVIEESHIQMPTCKTEPLDIPLKKTKLIDDTYNLIEYHQYQQALLYAQAQFRQQQQQMSAFRPWAQITPKHLPHLPYTAGLPYLSQEPPILQNPERVVKLEECERFERSFQPNVALAPRRHHNNNNNNNNNNNLNNNNNNNLNNNNNNFIIKERDRDRTRLHATTTTSLTTSATTGTTLTASTTITTAKTTALTTTTTSLTTTTLSSSSRVIGGIGGSGNVNETGIGLTTAAIGTTTDIIQIKQERPSTPPDEILSNSPELRVTQSPIEQPQFSPEAFSGSNEITSSTSPVLTLKSGDTLLNSPLHQISVPMENLHHHNHHHNHINNNNHHHHYHNNNNNNNLINNNNHRIQQSPIMLKNCSNAIMGNPEFELSTDTDDDSMTGEPDSSNTNVPLELAADILKDVRPDDKDKVLNIIKMLLHENVQLRHFSMENQEELRRKDEQINELLRQQQHFEQQQRRHQIPLSPVEPSVIAKPENNIDNIVIDRSYRTEKLEVIMKPLKKSLLRRSPEETVVVLQQTKREDNIDQSKDSITRINLDLITDKVKDIPLIKNTDSG